MQNDTTRTLPKTIKLARRNRLNRYRLMRTGALMLLLSFACAEIQPEAQAQVAPGRTTRTGAAGGLGAGLREYNNNSTVGDATITVDPETRRIIVITDEETNQHIGQVITNLDTPQPQVLIKVIFLEVTYRDASDVGVEGKGTIDLRKTATGQLESAFGLAAEPRGAFLRVINDNLQVTLRAMAEAGKLEVLSRPSILARNNQQALITVGQEVPFVRNTQITALGQVINQVEYEDIGIILRVTPFIRSDGLVEMIVSPEISTITDQTIPISDTVNAPVFAKRAADTVVVTQDGQTVVIGGMMENRKTQNVKKIPGLGDVPVLGALFRRKVWEDAKTELIIFLTPHVVYEPSQLGAMTMGETDKAKIAPQAFTEEELDRFIDGLPLKKDPPGGRIPEQKPKTQKKETNPLDRRKY